MERQGYSHNRAKPHLDYRAWCLRTWGCLIGAAVRGGQWVCQTLGVDNSCLLPGPGALIGTTTSLGREPDFLPSFKFPWSISLSHIFPLVSLVIGGSSLISQKEAREDLTLCFREKNKIALGTLFTSSWKEQLICSKPGTAMSKQISRSWEHQQPECSLS